MRFYFLLSSLLLPFLLFSQNKRAVIDSIHTKRLCVDYPGLVYEPDIVEEFATAKYVFTGKVVEIIRREYMEPKDMDRNGNPIHYEPEQHFWYILEVKEQFKGEPKKRITVYSRIFSSMSPLLILDKEYLIFANMVREKAKRFFRESQYVYFYCNGASTHLKYAEESLKILRKLKKN